MSISFNRTREQLGATILGEMGVKASGLSADSADLVVVYEAIDMRLKALHENGIIWHKVVDTPLEFSLTAGVVTASATVDILFPIKATVVDNDEDKPLRLIDPKQYAGIDDKSETGVPEVIMWEGSAAFRVWPVPQSNTTVKLVYEKYTDDTTAGAVLDLPVQMLICLKDIIKFEIGDAWGKGEETMKRWERRAEMAQRKLRTLNAPRIDYKTVAVDNFDGWEPQGNRTSDYGR